MRTLRRLFLATVWTFLISCRHEPVDLVLDTERQYKHDLYDEAECRRLRQLNQGFELSCSELALFNPNGQVSLLLGGSDILISSTYEQNQKTITVKSAPGLPKELVFNVISETELIRIDNNTRWQLE